MTIDVRIKGNGKGKTADVDDSRALKTTVTGFPPEGDEITLLPFSTDLANDAGSTDLRVAASLAAPQKFYLSARSDADRYVHTISFTIADSGITFDVFGALSILTNGCRFYYEDSQFGDIQIGPLIKTNYDLLKLCTFEPGFGSGSEAFILPSVTAAPQKSSALVATLDIEDVFGIQYGIKLPKGTNKRLVMELRDDVSGLDQYTITAYGFDRISK